MSKDKTKQKTCDICPRPAVWEHRYEESGAVARYCQQHKPVGPPPHPRKGSR